MMQSPMRWLFIGLLLILMTACQDEKNPSLDARNSPTPSPTASITATIAPPLATASPTARPALPTNTPGAVCECHSDNLNCGDFSRRQDAQACYEYCTSQGKGDIHRLDGDKDGAVCESLP